MGVGGGVNVGVGDGAGGGAHSHVPAQILAITASRRGSAITVSETEGQPPRRAIRPIPRPSPPVEGRGVPSGEGRGVPLL